MKTRSTFARVLAAALLTSATVSYAAPDWLTTGTLGNADIYSGISNAEMDVEIAAQKARNVSVLELDTSLSYYLNDTEFDAEVLTIDTASKKAHAQGLKTVIYYPAMEVLTRNGVNLPNSMFKDHPEWIQQGINGDPNVFYGTQEVWVEATDESAWMSPNTGYRDYFLDRIRRLAATDVDGIWIDVPIYLDTGAGWAGAEPAAAADFNTWSIVQGLGGGSGYTTPTTPDFSNPAFRAWVHWRHLNLAGFIEDIRVAATEINPDIVVMIEDFPMDYMDATKAGLDANLVPTSDNLVHVWELDSVSNTLASQWSNYDDFRNKIAMTKWGKGVQRDNASVAFSYGNIALDAGLTMGAIVATGTAPFEAKTPDMTQSVSSEFRTKWFGFVRDHSAELLQAKRQSNVGVWYSSATRNFQDFPIGGEYGMFSSTTAPTVDPDWWSTASDDSVTRKPHLGGYRGISSAMIELAVPYRVVNDPGDPAGQVDGLDLLFLPSVAAMSDSAANIIKDYVSNGGVVLATGFTPGTLDELGNVRTSSILDDLFSFDGSTSPDRRVNKFGEGLAIYRPDLQGKNLFGETLDATVAATTLSEIEQMVRIHADEIVSVENGDEVFVEVGVTDSLNHHLYLLNYSGLQQPLVSAPKVVTVRYRPPAGFGVKTAIANTPDNSGQSGAINVVDEGHGVYRLAINIDQFALIDLTLESVSAETPDAYAGPSFSDPAQQEAAESGIAFILNSMRNPSLPEPYNYGVHTNLVDNTDSTEVYTNGHHVTAEHMGLLLRSSACMKNEAAYDDAYRYVDQAMSSDLYHVPNWSIDKFAQRPFVEFNEYQNLWLNANAPLDDMRVIRGLMDGYELLGRSDAEELARTFLNGLYWTTVTDRDRGPIFDFPAYSGGLLGFAWDWSELTDNTLSPPSVSTGQGVLTQDLIPVDYQDLGTMALMAQRDHRWATVFNSATDLLLDSEISNSGLFYNGLEQTGAFTGDFEYQGDVQGTHLKTIQVLWTAIHLARAANLDTGFLSNSKKQQAKAAAERNLAFYKNYLSTNGRIPEYMTFAGGDVPDCDSNGQPEDSCLVRGDANLFSGEARIYAQLARLALLLDDPIFANDVINGHIMTDRVTDTNDPRYGVIGTSTTGSDDAEAWNILESVLTLCLYATYDDSTDPTDPIDPPDPTGTPSNVASNITLDGNLDDWSSYQSFGVDGDDLSPDAGPIDWQEAWFAHDGGDLFIAYQNNGPVASSWGQTLYLDTDDNTTTGFQSGLPIGADYLIQGQYLYAYAGTANGSTWNWNFVMQMQGFLGSDTFEFRLPRSAIGNPGTIRLAFVGANEAFSASGRTDFYPNDIYNTSSSDRFLSYQLDDVSNSSPVVNDQSITTMADTSVGITLTGSDFDGDALTFLVATQPANGSLSGAAPNMTYTPSSGFSGIDSFTYNANDGTVSSTNATVTITVQSDSGSGLPSNLVSNLTLDGSLSDWSNYESFGPDAQDSTGANNPIDYREVWMGHDASNFYLAHSNSGPDLATIGSWGFNAYLDTDRDSATGFSNGLQIGADYLQQGDYVYQYIGDGNSWAWAYLGGVTRSVASASAEIAFDRNAIGDPDTLDIVVLGDNLSLGGSIEDSYPDGARSSAAEVRYYSYTVGGLAAIGDGGLNLAAATPDIQPENGQLELQANARRPDSSIAVQSGGSGGGRTGVPFVLALLSICLLRSHKLNRTRQRA